MTTVVYRVDSQNRITAAGGDWQHFAEANDGADVLQQNVIGQRLLNFVQDETVRVIYAAIIAHARRGHAVRFRYRCDAPALRRDFEMTVSLLSTGEVEFCSTLLKETPRPAIELFRTRRRKPTKLVRMCSWCHAIADRRGHWHELDQAIVSMPVLEEHESVGVTHGICPACAKTILDLLQHPRVEPPRVATLQDH